MAYDDYRDVLRMHDREMERYCTALRDPLELSSGHKLATASPINDPATATAEAYQSAVLAGYRDPLLESASASYLTSGLARPDDVFLGQQVTAIERDIAVTSSILEEARATVASIHASAFSSPFGRNDEIGARLAPSQVYGVSASSTAAALQQRAASIDHEISATSSALSDLRAAAAAIQGTASVSSPGRYDSLTTQLASSQVESSAAALQYRVASLAGDAGAVSSKLEEARVAAVMVGKPAASLAPDYRDTLVDGWSNSRMSGVTAPSEHAAFESARSRLIADIVKGGVFETATWALT
ncbi:hypothetical protein [Azospirillum sp. sgz301742]